MRPAAVTFIIALLVVSIPTFLNVLPGPIVHDEWAYLLQADTFAHGRLANAPHQHWEFFETMHVLQQPTYAAKFPPMQAITLALGQVLGDPMYGVIGTIALACAAITWMWRAVMPERWAVASGVVAATHPIVFGWGQSYWGGGAAILSAAVFGGAALRLYHRKRWHDGVVLAIGLGMLANSRPLEGLLLVIACFVVTVATPRLITIALASWRSWAPAAALTLLPILACMLYYNQRVTGNALRLPYAEHTAQYMNAPLFWWQSAREVPIEYRHPALAKFHLKIEPEEWLSQLGARNYIAGIGRKLAEIKRDWFRPPVVLLPILAALLLQRNRRAWTAAAICVALPFIHFALTPWFRPHYLAVLAPLFFGIAAIGMRAMWLRGILGRIVVVLVMLGQVYVVGLLVRHQIMSPSIAGLPRQQVVTSLMQAGGKHVVFIHYEGESQTILEWVYNSADIDSQTIVFARDMGAQNSALRSYYPDRRAWLVTVRGISASVAPLP